ncbi:MAG: oligoendopeptidase F [Clostridiales bacterium]|jgi:oligoendopeptidase F|nr:oligoendopeptidase F [Clostridiales bacterium]
MKVLKRSEIDGKYKWKTTDIFESDAAFYARLDELSKKTEILGAYKGKLNDKGLLLEVLRKEEGISKDLNLLGLYAHMKKDEDTKEVKYSAMYDKVVALSVKISSDGSYITPEISAFDGEYLQSLITDKDFADFDYMLSEILRNKAHILSDKEEKLMAEMHNFSSKFKETFTMFDNADILFDKIKTRDGETIELTHGLYGVLLQSHDRRLRKKAYEAMFSAYKRYINTIAANYSGNVMKNVFSAKVRNYDGALDRALSGENVDSIVYENLLEAVDLNVGCLHRYVSLRRKVLGYKTLHFYDMYVPIVADADIKLEYVDAFELVKRALAPMGDEYVKLLEQAYKGGWIDVCENANKRSGAYSTDAYGVHPYVLLNYQQTTHDVFTIAHELGHALHSYYSNKNQPYSKAGYEIFVAEVASTVNEVLLLEYLLKKAKGDERKYLLSYYLDMFRTTLFRQSMFAEFERFAHEMGEKDTPINADSLSEGYKALNRKYYGDDIVYDEFIECEWARIPHFYNAFYVYKYATGIISAVSIADALLNDNQRAVKEYKKFLSAGGSASPVDILKLAGADLRSKEPFEKAMKVFSRVLAELEKEYGKE